MGEKHTLFLSLLRATFLIGPNEGHIIRSKCQWKSLVEIPLFYSKIPGNPIVFVEIS